MVYIGVLGYLTILFQLQTSYNVGRGGKMFMNG